MDRQKAHSIITKILEGNPVVDTVNQVAFHLTKLNRDNRTYTVNCVNAGTGEDFTADDLPLIAGILFDMNKHWDFDYKTQHMYWDGIESVSVTLRIRQAKEEQTEPLAL